MSNIVQKMCKEYKVQLLDKAVTPEEPLDPYYNGNSACCRGSNPLIILGRYQNPEFRLISFFHELGHIVATETNVIPQYKDLPYPHYEEAVAWRIGLRLAEKRDILFSKHAISWAKEKLISYFKDDCLEHTPLKFLETALNEAFAAR